MIKEGVSADAVKIPSGRDANTTAHSRNECHGCSQPNAVFRLTWKLDLGRRREIGTEDKSGRRVSIRAGFCPRRLLPPAVDMIRCVRSEVIMMSI